MMAPCALGFVEERLVLPPRGTIHGKVPAPMHPAALGRPLLLGQRMFSRGPLQMASSFFGLKAEGVSDDPEAMLDGPTIQVAYTL